MNRLHVALVDRAAMQWSALGVAIQAPRERTVVDLEALIGLTAALGGVDARVWEGSIAWCGVHGRSVNSARLKRVVAEMGIATDALAEFGAAARRAGAPPWPMAGRAERSTPRGESRDDLVLARPARDGARLLWLLRATFGVNARADIVANLLARPGSSLTVLGLAHLTRFTKRNAAVALEDLVLSGVVERLGIGAVGRFRLRDRRGLLRWLDLPASVDYPDEVARYTIDLGVAAFLDTTTPSPRVQAIEAREVVTRLRPSIKGAGLLGQDLRVTGPAFAGAFDAWVDQLAGRLEHPVKVRLPPSASSPVGNPRSPASDRLRPGSATPPASQRGLAGLRWMAAVSRMSALMFPN